MRSELELLLKLTLDPLEKKVIRLRFGLDDGHPKSPAATGKILGGKNSTMVKSIEARALLSLRKPAFTARLDEFLVHDFDSATVGI
mmetsp:Transcript_2811/g.5937  ORF Transcript_2811/g.5937 Transcript_2811/m.5937 type:complete len:86 (-) Transcript_2811:420-677(-)